jgi:hypothetical protein
MRKNVLALSIAAMIGGIGFAGAASASVIPGTATLTATTMTLSNANSLVVAEGGVGHMLLVPYYSAQNNNMTVLHVVNTDTVNGKAIKVRFRGAANSDDVMDFQVFMSPGDVWTAAVTAGANGIAQVVTADNTCSVPALGINAPKQFSTDRLSPALTDPEKAANTREGYVEIFNMADIAGNKIFGATGNANSALFTATKHVSKVAPCSVAGSPAETTLFNTALTEYPTEASAAAAGFDTPSGGLLADWYIINVPETTTFSGGGTAIVASVTSVDSPAVSGRGNFVHFPQINTPVSSTVIDNFTADPLLRTTSGPALAAGSYDLPDFSTPYTVPASTTAPIDQADFLTGALAVTSVTNQYANDLSITAKTDWVFSMPTRRYHVAADYTEDRDSVDYRVFSTGNNVWFNEDNTSVDETTGNICVTSSGQRFWDREETTPGASAPGPVFSPQTPGVTPNVRLCGEASVLSFVDTGNSVLAAGIARTTLTQGSYENGWGTVLVPNNGFGLPILGASFIKLANPNVGNGRSGTFGITWPHRFTRPLPPI